MKIVKTPFNFSSTAGTQPNVPKFDKFLHKCDIKDKHAVDGIILPVCVPRLDPIVVFSNYTKPQYAKYLKNSNYIGAGIASEDNWMVVVLSTNTTTGNFSGAASLIANILYVGFVPWIAACFSELKCSRCMWFIQIYLLFTCFLCWQGSFLFL